MVASVLTVHFRAIATVRVSATISHWLCASVRSHKRFFSFFLQMSLYFAIFASNYVKKSMVMEDSILNKYLDEIGREQLLSQEEEARLSARVLKGDERALNKLIEANLRFVIVIARQYQGKGLAVEDLVSEGNMGLMKAARKFDASRGLRFVNYAVVFIRRQIEKALEKEGAEQRVESTRDGQTRSVDAPLGSKANVSLLSVLVNKDSPLADQRVYSANMEDAVERALTTLNLRERAVVNACFGLGQERMTMAEIGEQMNLRRERVRQIRDRAVRRMRKACTMNYAL